ncbi:MAG TPA: hypothetical protein VI357_19255 [Mycobacteriales bacterium]
MTDVPKGSSHGSGRYEFRVRGHLDTRWAAWFDGLSLTRERDGTTVLAGVIADQAALHGVLRKLADLGLPLVSVTPAAADPPTTTHPC